MGKLTFQTDKVTVQAARGQRWIAVPVPPEVDPDIIQDKVYDIEISLHRNKRSLDANALFWKCVQGLAQELRTSKDEMYLSLLERYGDYEFLIVKPQAVKEASKLFRIAREHGLIKVGSGQGMQLQVWVGSSHYNTEQMSRLIDGTISECKDLGTWYPDSDELKSGLILWEERE